QRLQLVFHQALRIVKQPPDQRGLAIIHAAAGVEAQNLNGMNCWHHEVSKRRFRQTSNEGPSGIRISSFGNSSFQKYPSFFRSSIAASEVLSSARKPLSVTRAVAISAIISSTESAGDSTIPVLIISPMVRTRTT